MESIEFFLMPYRSYSGIQIVMEIIAAIAGIASVVYAIRKNILVYPVGIVSTALYTYLLFQWDLYGEMMINAYYTLMSLYGWLTWKKMNESHILEVTSLSLADRRFMILILIVSFGLVLIIYKLKYFTFSAIPIVNYVDSIVTAFFLLAMYLMARMKIENWYFWILGNLLSIPLFIYKGYGITAFQYLVFLGLAFRGMTEWQKTKEEVF